MKTFLIWQDLWVLVFVGYIEPTNETVYNALYVDEKTGLKDNMKMDAKSLFIFQTWVDITVFPNITECSKSHDAWETLENEYKGFVKVKFVKLQMLGIYFESRTMKENESVEYFITRVQNIENFIHDHGESLEDWRIVEKVLRNLPKNFDPITISIEESRNLS